MKEDHKDAVSILPEALEEEFVRLPADLARWNELYAEATGRAMDAKHKVDRIYAKCFVKYRRASDDDETPKRRTESEVKALIELDVAYQAALSELTAATKEKLRLYGIVDAIRAKRDSLISIGAQHRAELRPSRIREHSHKDDDEEDDDD